MRFQTLALTGLLSLAALGAGTAASQAQDSYVIRSSRDGQGLAIRVRPRSWLDCRQRGRGQFGREPATRPPTRTSSPHPT